MFEYPEPHFIDLVPEVFGSTMQELGFEIHEEDQQLLYAQKGNIQVFFRLETGYKIRLFSLEIMLLGELGERATSKPDYRNLKVSTIAQFSDPNYEVLYRVPATEDEFREEMEIQKAELLHYCKDILNGDISRWPQIVDMIIEQTGFIG